MKRLGDILVSAYHGNIFRPTRLCRYRFGYIVSSIRNQFRTSIHIKLKREELKKAGLIESDM